MRYLLLFLALAAVAVVAVLLARPRRRSDSTPEPITDHPLVGLAEPDPVLPPVLLPEHPRGADVDAVRLSVGLRGYRCDQVDQLLDGLSAEIERLHDELARARSGPETAPDGAQDGGTRTSAASEETAEKSG
ncbi:MAG: DivIVA domain-containing protein [Galactobacter sp.]